MSHARLLSSLPIWLAFVAAVSTAPALGDEPVKLRRNLESGLTYTVRYRTRVQETRQLPGGNQRYVQRLRTDFKHNVLKIKENGDYRVRTAFEEVFIKEKTPRVTYTYDSATDPAPDRTTPFPAHLYHALVGQSFISIQSRTGKIRKIIGAGKIADRTIERLGLPSGSDAEPARKHIRELLSPETLRAHMNAMSAAYPEKPLTPGQSWSNASVGRVGFVNADLMTRYTLNRFNNEAVFLDVRARIQNAKQEPVHQGATTLQFDFSGTKRGIMRIDPETGLPRRARFTLKVRGDVQLDSPKLAEKVTIPTVITATKNTALIKGPSMAGDEPED